MSTNAYLEATGLNLRQRLLVDYIDGDKNGENTSDKEQIVHPSPVSKDTDEDRHVMVIDPSKKYAPGSLEERYYALVMEALIEKPAASVSVEEARKRIKQRAQEFEKVFLASQSSDGAGDEDDMPALVAADIPPSPPHVAVVDAPPPPPPPVVAAGHTYAIPPGSKILSVTMVGGGGDNGGKAGEVTRFTLPATTMTHSVTIGFDKNNRDVHATVTEESGATHYYVAHGGADGDSMKQ